MSPSAWSWSAEALVPLALVVVYVRVVRSLVSARALAFLAGCALLAAALVTPLDTLAREYLVWAHLVQNVVLAEWAPLLLVLGIPPAVAGRLGRLPVVALLTRPVVALPLWIGSYVVWHVPALYDAALEHPVVHVLEHLSFAGAGLLYWWHLLSPIRSRLRLGGLGPVLYMASTKILVGFLGVLLAFSPTLLYEAYALAPGETRWGLTPLDDQHVAGLIMALEQSIVMGIALAYLFVRMLAESEEEDRRAERFGEDREFESEERYGAV